MTPRHKQQNGKRPFTGICNAWACLLLIVLAGGCSQPYPAPQQPAAVKPAPLPRELSPDTWRVKWPGDTDNIILTPANKRLQISFDGKPRASKGLILAGRLKPGYHLENETIVEFELKNGPDQLLVAMALETDQYYETPQEVVSPDTTRILRFNVTNHHFKSAATDWAFTGTVNRADALRSLSLVIYPDPGATRTLQLVRCSLKPVTPPPVKPLRQIVAPALRSLAVPSNAVPQYGLLEIPFETSIASANPFDPASFQVDALLTDPKGRQHICPAFVYQPQPNGQALDQWRVRFSPGVAGSWSFSLRLKTPEQTVVSKTHPFTCTASTHPGPIRIPAAHPHIFEYANGDSYYPIGHNVCWNSLEEYREQFRAMGRHGENWSRIWIAPWNCDIEWNAWQAPYEGLGLYNLENAKKLDRIVELAENNGLMLQMVLHEHCRVDSQHNPEWHNNPYNQALGGPCENPIDFFTDSEAKRLTRNRLRYIVARWGYSPNVMAWELFNEASLATGFDAAIDTAWHREMGQYIRQLDPHKHLLTTSYAGAPNAAVFRLPEIDFTQSHIYITNIIETLASRQPMFERFNKPWFVGEFGRHTDDGIDAKDQQGLFLHAGIWAQLMLPCGGNAMSWWWYDHIHPHHLYPHFKALADFAAKLDRPSATRPPFFGKVHAETTVFHGISQPFGNTLAGWLYNPAVLPWNPSGGFTPQAHSLELAFSNLSTAGSWTFEQWDTWKGRTVQVQELHPQDDVVRVTVKTVNPDTAFRLYPTQASTNGTPPRLVAQPWQPREKQARKRIAIAPVSTPVVLDGQLNEWRDIPRHAFGDDRETGAPKVRFALAHDDSYLYVAAVVRDASLCRQQVVGSDLWRDDNLEVWIDARGNADYFSNLPNNLHAYQVNLAPSTQLDGPMDQVIYRHPTWNNRSHPQVSAYSRHTAEGYRVEARFPLTEWANQAGMLPHQIGINISLCDADAHNPDAWRHYLWQGDVEYDATQWAVGTLSPGNKNNNRLNHP